MDVSYEDVKIAEAVNNSVVLEIWKRGTQERVYFDVICKTETKIGEDRFFSSFLRVVDVPCLVIAATRAMEYISVCHKEMRRFGRNTKTVATTDIITTWAPVEHEDRQDERVIPYIRPVREFKCGSVVAELYINEGGTYLARFQHEWHSDSQWNRSEFLQQRELRDLIIVATEMWKYLEKYPDGEPVEEVDGNVASKE